MDIRLSIEPFSYQQSAIERCRAEYIKGARRVLLVLPPRGGKTETSGFTLASSLAKGKWCLFLADRQLLVTQCSRKYSRMGIQNSILMDGYEPDFFCKMHIASKQTLWSRAFQRKRWELPPYDFIVVEEAHNQTGKTAQAIKNKFPDAYQLLITGTPIGPGGKELTDIDAMVIGATHAQLRELGYLVPLSIYAPTVPDLVGVKTRGGDYEEDALAKVMGQRKIVGDLLTHWKRCGKGEPTVGFGCTVGHSIEMAKEFSAKGIPSGHVDADDAFWVDREGERHRTDRETLFEMLKDGELKVLWNYGILGTGVDLPFVSVEINARPTKSLALWRQMAMRVATKFEGKTEGVILDHTGNTLKHGRPDTDIAWTIGTGANIQQEYEALRNSQKKEREPICCPMCFAYREGGQSCTACGFKPERRGENVPVVDGELFKLDDASLERAQRQEDDRKYWNKLINQAFWGKRKDVTMQMIGYQFKEARGYWPNWKVEAKCAPYGEPVWKMKVAAVYADRFEKYEEQLGKRLNKGPMLSLLAKNGMGVE